MLGGDSYIVNRQTPAPNAHTTLTQFKMPNYWLVDCRVRCAKVVGATSSGSFLVGTSLTDA